MRKIQAFKKFTFTLDYTTSLGLTKRTIAMEISQAVRFRIVVCITLQSYLFDSFRLNIVH